MKHVTGQCVQNFMYNVKYYFTSVCINVYVLKGNAILVLTNVQTVPQFYLICSKKFCLFLLIVPFYCFVPALCEKIGLKSYEHTGIYMQDMHTVY